MRFVMSAYRLAVDLMNVNNDRRLWTRIQDARIARIGAPSIHGLSYVVCGPPIRVAAR
jgi:hypothetical protein